jgi:PIN domain nuclease of toxin-antitoxin system
VTAPRLLLDTHIALWWFAGNAHLTEAARDEIALSQCWLSAVSIWEVAIKFRLGKLPIAPDVMLGAARAGGFRLLPVAPDHAVATVDLAPIHSDPFDRLLVAQANWEGMPLLTADSVLAAYGSFVRVMQ